MARESGDPRNKSPRSPISALMSRKPIVPAADTSGPNPPQAVVRFEGVSMRYGREPEVLKDISFELERGGFYFVTGASGSGKSTLLKLVYLAEQASRGR